MTTDEEWADDDEPVLIPFIGMSDAVRHELTPILAALKQYRDDTMVSAVMSTPKAGRKMTQLSPADRAWLVAGLTAAGVTAASIAERLGCSLRLVRSLRADPITQLCECILRADKVATDQLRSEKVDHQATRGLLNEARADANRARLQRDQLLEQYTATGTVETFDRCRHPKIKYNTYEHGGRKYCRECHRIKQAEYRTRNRAATCAVITSCLPVNEESVSV